MFLARQAIDHRHRFDGRILVQAQHHQISGGHQLAFGFGVFATGRIDAQHLHVRHQRQALTDLQTGGARFAVDENFSHGIAFCGNMQPSVKTL